MECHRRRCWRRGSGSSAVGCCHWSEQVGTPLQPGENGVSEGCGRSSLGSQLLLFFFFFLTERICFFVVFLLRSFSSGCGGAWPGCDLAPMRAGRQGESSAPPRDSGR